MSALTLIHAAYVVPVRPARAVLEKHAVIVDSGRIAEILPSQRAREKYPDQEAVVLPDHVLLPGLINMHTHSPMTLFRGYADDKDMQAWLREDIWPLEAAWVGPDFVRDGTRLAVAEMIRAGTTCFNENYFFPDVIAEVAIDAGIRACVGLPLIELPTAWAADIDQCFERGLELLSRHAGCRRLIFALAPHAPYTVGDATLERIASLSRERDFLVHMHLLETHWERKQSLLDHGRAPLQRLDAHHLLDSRLLAVHMTQLEVGEIDLIAEREVNVVHCPESNLKLASGLCPLGPMLQAGVNATIGTDGAASNNDLDLLEEARVAALLTKGLTGQPHRPDAFEVLEWVTVNAAKALGMEDRLGSIEVGKQADLAALDLARPRTQPVYDVVSAIVYSAASSQFTDVWVEGQRLMRGGILTTLDEAAILEGAAAWRARVTNTGATRSALA